MSASNLPLFQDHGAPTEKPSPNIRDASRFGAAGSTKRRNILIASAVAAVVIIAVIIGGVAGGLASHKSTKAAATIPSPTAPSGTGPTAPPRGGAGCNATSQLLRRGLAVTVQRSPTSSFLPVAAPPPVSDLPPAVQAVGAAGKRPAVAQTTALRELNPQPGELYLRVE
ncbi:hypothetical protein FIBSPDRAFT_881623 [Athelia psychrophila]|uniref:Uncharacterized protein n=1 Tax=Athelia psychrophila TaxID=1759441 RepID=A0A166W648_9AGAM|nr:hypothetical protein FIBSPDRAFT_881623 [Fibularhizoctonia sp. CBS 109695]